MNNNILNETFKKHLKLLNEKLNLRKLMGGDDDDSEFILRTYISPYLKIIITLNGEEAEVDLELVENNDDTEFRYISGASQMKKISDFSVVIEEVKVNGKHRLDLFDAAEEWATRPENLKKIIRALNQRNKQTHQDPPR